MQDIKAIRNELNDLRKKIRYHNKKYYNDDSPEISDHEYDQLMQRLKQIEAEYPEFITSTSPTQLVGGKAKRTAGKLVPHDVPMLSLQDVFTREEVLKLKPDDITIHALALKRGSRLQMNLADDLIDLNKLKLPSDQIVRDMAIIAEKMIREKNYKPYYLYRQGYMSGQIENVGYCLDGAEGIYNVQIMDERQTIIGVGGAATTKIVDFKNNCLQSVFNAKDLITYIRDVDIYIRKRDDLLEKII